MLNPPIHRREQALLAVALLLAVAAVLAPPVAQSASHHDFADRSIWLGITHARDVLTNLPFALLGMLGLSRLRRQRAALEPTQHRAMQVFFWGLLATAVGSSVYHWAPDDDGLALDRLGMAIAFAGLLGLAVAQRVSARAGALTVPAVLLAGGAAVGWWWTSANVLPWALVQFGGMLVVLVLAALRPVPAPHGVNPAAVNPHTVNLLAVIAAYTLAKAFELADHPVHAATAGWVSGHNLKHLLAAAAAWPVVAALADTARARAPGQSPAPVAQTPAGTTAGATAGTPATMPVGAGPVMAVGKMDTKEVA